MAKNKTDEGIKTRQSSWFYLNNETERVEKSRTLDPSVDFDFDLIRQEVKIMIQ